MDEIEEHQRELKIEMLKELLSFWNSNGRHYNNYTEEHPACPCLIRWEYIFNIDENTKWGQHGY